jgi:hypothetical protein
MLKAARAFSPHTIVHLGDLADFYKVSSHSKDPSREHTFKQEVVVVRALRAQLDSLGARRKIFIEGNHEDRLRRYLQDKAPELHDEISTDKLLKLTENGWKFVAYKDSIRLGKVYLTHDTGQSGKYTTARALETFQHSVVIGHHHALQYHVMGDATGQHQIGAQFGWLGDVKQVDYMHRVKAKRNWALGFGTGYHETATGVIYISPVPIVNYSVCVGGRVYRA